VVKTSVEGIKQKYMIELDALKKVEMTDRPKFKENGKRYVSPHPFITADGDHFVPQRHEKSENLLEGWVHDVFPGKHLAQY